MSRREVEDRVAEFVELAEQGRAVDPTSYASRFPRIERELLAALEALAETESLLPAQGGELPSHVGPYRVEGEIGSGGMGRVLRVSSPAHPGRELALKLLHPVAALDPRSAERFRREGEILAALAHENIVRVLEVGMFGANPFIVMEHVEGRSLAELVRAARARTPEGEPRGLGELPGEGDGWRRAARIVASLARAVETVHRAGALHRDIKPANVILRPDGSPVLVDFGLVHSPAAATLTRTGDLLGTPQYMAPEQARGEATDARADVYGLGALLYELCALAPAHAGDDALKVLDAVRNRPVPRLSKRARGVPRDLEAIVHRALAFRPRHRTPSAARLAEDLEAFLAGKRVAAAPPNVLERADALWTFHRGRIAAAALAVLLLATVLPAWRSLAARERAAAEAAFERGLRAWIERDDEVAVREARAAQDRDPGHRWAGVLGALASGGEFAGSADPAIEALAQGWRKHQAQQHAQAAADFARAAELAPGDALPRVLLGLEAQLADDEDLAQRELSAALTILPRSPRLLEELGSVLYDRRDLASAEQSFLAALELAPERAELWERLARTRFRRGKNGPGLEASEQAVQLAGENAGARILMTHGALLDVAGRRADAQAAFERARALEPDASGPPTSLAMSLDSDHKLREAQDAYWQAAQVGPPAKALMCLAYLYAGSNSAKCDQCRSYFEDNPDLLDPERAESCALSALDADGGREPGLPPTAAMVANQIERRDAIRAKLESLRDAAIEDKLIARYEKAVRMLRD